MLISGHQCYPVKSYVQNLIIRQLHPMYSALQNRWFPELYKGAIFEQDSLLTLFYLSKCNTKLSGISGNSKKMFFMNRSNVQALSINFCEQFYQNILLSTTHLMIIAIAHGHFHQNVFIAPAHLLIANKLIVSMILILCGPTFPF